MTADEDTPDTPPLVSAASPAGLPAPSATMLPAVVPERSGRSTRLLITVAGIVVVVLIAGGLIALLGGGSKTTTKPVAARAEGKVPTAAVFATSNAVAADTAGVVTDAESLLAGKLPVAAVSQAVRDSLTHPPSLGSATPVLGAALALDDPQLPGCIASVTGGDTLFGIDRISYAGAPSLLVVTADSNSGSDALAYVIGAGCAQPGTGIRTVVTVPL